MELRAEEALRIGTSILILALLIFSSRLLMCEELENLEFVEKQVPPSHSLAVELRRIPDLERV